ncbi:MAG: hypothetical protein J5494_04085, partial [Candidatus Methanomethylophilaceae archaeon]|nr:hypothetical protein [Candidatus Methanomethylophilaceae archaeon]
MIDASVPASHLLKRHIGTRTEQTKKPITDLLSEHSRILLSLTVIVLALTFAFSVSSESDAAGELTVSVDSVPSSDGNIRADLVINTNPGEWTAKIVAEFDN